MKIKDHFLTGEEFSLVDDGYGNLQTIPIPKEITNYYKSENYLSHTKQKNLLSKVYTLFQKLNHWYKRKIIYKNNFIKAPKILDYGCGDGSWVNYMSTWFEIDGYEPILKSENPKIKKELTQLKDTYDIITLWHVFEHIADRVEVLNFLKSKLKNDGLLVLALPNYKSFDAKFYKEFWAGYDVPRHVYHYNQNGLSKFLNDNGLKIIKKYPLWWDSFFVSLLSERYKKNKLGVIRFIFIGLFSNLKGIFTKEYSSIIYLINRSE